MFGRNLNSLTLQEPTGLHQSWGLGGREESTCVPCGMGLTSTVVVLRLLQGSQGWASTVEALKMGWASIVVVLWLGLVQRPQG